MSRAKGIRLVAAGLATALLFAGLVHLVLVAAGVSQSAATTVYGMTIRRFWATTSAGIGLIGVAAGIVALRVASVNGRGANLALGLGLLAAISGLLNVTLATGGPGTGNGVVGGAAAVVLGLIASALGGMARARLTRGAAALGS